MLHAVPRSYRTPGGSVYTPLLNHLDNLKRDLARVKSYDNQDDDEWIANLSAQVIECERYFMEV